MIIVGLIFSVFGIGLLCWLLFTLAVYALPFYAGLTAFFAAYHGGAGVLGAIVVDVLAGAATLMVGQFLFASARSPIARGAIALLYAAPAAIVGFYMTLGLSRIGTPSLIWSDVFAVVGAICVGGIALVRLRLGALTTLAAATGSSPTAASKSAGAHATACAASQMVSSVTFCSPRSMLLTCARSTLIRSATASWLRPA